MRRVVALAVLSTAVSLSLTALAFLMTRSGRLHLPGAVRADGPAPEVSA